MGGLGKHELKGKFWRNDKWTAIKSDSIEANTGGRGRRKRILPIKKSNLGAKLNKF